MQNKLVQKLLFHGGLNLDDDHKEIAVGDYVYALNFRNKFTENGIDGSAENISSNVQVAYSMPAGTNKCNGIYEDPASNTVFYFIWNSNDDHLILRYYPASTGNGSIQEIVADSILGFTEN